MNCGFLQGWWGRGSLLQVPLPHRLFGNSWDSDEDMAPSPPPQGHLPRLPHSDGNCSHPGGRTDEETETRRGTQGLPAMTAVPGERGGGGELGKEPEGKIPSLSAAFPTSADSASLGEPAVPPKGLDCYLDSLFDPVLSYGDAVGMRAERGALCGNLMQPGGAPHSPEVPGWPPKGPSLTLLPSSG